MIDSQEFTHYLSLLNHPDQRQRVDALQDMFFLLLNRRRFHPDQWERLIPVLVEQISSGTDATLRRWAYQVGTFSSNNNRLLLDYCIYHFDKETDPENRSWIAAFLSKNLTKEGFYKVLSEKDHGLTQENIALATYLFADYDKISVREVLRRSDPLSLMWIASIGAYKNIAVHNRREIMITQKDLTRLTGETDNDEVLKHVMYAFFLQKSFCVKELLFSPFEYEKMGNQQKKWFFSLIWKDSKFIAENIDYFRELLSEQHLFRSINPEVRIGLARGLSGSVFSKDLTDNIMEWYSHEDSPSVLYYLLKYFQRYQELSGDYREAVEYQKKNGLVLPEGITSDSNLLYERDTRFCSNIFWLRKSDRRICLFGDINISINIQFGNKKINNYIENKEEVMGDKVMGSKYEVKKAMNVGPGAGANSTNTQNIYEGGRNEEGNCEALVAEIVKLKEYFRTQEDTDEHIKIRAKLIEAEEMVEEEKDFTGAVEILKKAGKELYIVARTVGCALIAGILKGFFNIP